MSRTVASVAAGTGEWPRLAATGVLAATLACPACWAGANAASTDPRLREVLYDARAVITVPVKRGVVTLVALGADEAIQEVAGGQGGDCARPGAVWCIAAQAGGRHLFVKPLTGASAANNLSIVTDRRSHAFRLLVLADGDPQPPLYRLSVVAPAAPPALPVMAVRPEASAAPAAARFAPPVSPPLPPTVPPEQLVLERLAAPPRVVNTRYSVAEGANSAEIVPSLVFDDGRFTYLRFAGNREVPAVFHVHGDGSEAVVNVRMEGDLLVVDRVSHRLTLRAGQAVVGLWNDAFDVEGVPPAHGTTVPGVERALRRVGVRASTSVVPGAAR